MVFYDSNRNITEAEGGGYEEWAIVVTGLNREDLETLD